MIVTFLFVAAVLYSMIMAIRRRSRKQKAKEAVEKRSQVYEIADDEDDENHAAAQCATAKAELIRAIEQLIEAKEKPSG